MTAEQKQPAHNYYEILGVPSNADSSTIHRAYRRNVRECHPDYFPNDLKRVNRFLNISAAYTILSNEDSRATYDATQAHEHVENRDNRPSGSRKSKEWTPADDWDDLSPSIYSIPELSHLIPLLEHLDESGDDKPEWYDLNALNREIGYIPRDRYNS